MYLFRVSDLQMVIILPHTYKQALLRVGHKFVFLKIQDFCSNSTHYVFFRAASIAQSATDPKRPRLVIWPEWSDADVNAEKWVSPTRQ